MKTCFKKLIIKLLLCVIIVLPINHVNNTIDDGRNDVVIVQTDVDLPIAW